MDDRKYMKLALSLAEKGSGFAAPNPLVGAVIVKDGRIIGQGYHERYGELHAERNALKNCTESPEGATMYVTLEPCCHYGKQPPCVNAILEAKIARVVVGSGDPNPLVSGKGIAILREHGVEVEEHVLEEECLKLNEVFFYHIQTKLPFVVMKYAMTMDGKIAAYTGESKWITGETARQHVQTQRHRYSAIMAGIGTVLKDDPLLTCRIEGGRNPIRIICDTRLRTPLDSQIVRTAGSVPTIIATCAEDAGRCTGTGLCAEADERSAAAGLHAGNHGRHTGYARYADYERAGCRILRVNEKNGHVDLKELMILLGREGIDSILLEGGGTLNWSALECGIVNKVQAYVAPKLFGGQGAKSPVEGRGFPSPAKCVGLKNSTIVRLGDDFLIESEVDQGVHRDC